MWRSLASALASDARGRRFKSGHPDGYPHFLSGCGAVWQARLLGMQEDVGSNPAIPISRIPPSERGAGGARPLWKRGAWVRFPPFRLTARGPTVGQWSVKPRRFGASGFNSRLAVLLRMTAPLRGLRVALRNPARPLAFGSTPASRSKMGRWRRPNLSIARPHSRTLSTSHHRAW